jgi:hypothetical protein
MSDCSRCGGCLHPSYAVDTESGVEEESMTGIPIRVCFSCGYWSDPVFDAHHAMGRPPEILCACGCGLEVNPGRRYIFGHQTHQSRVQGRRQAQQRGWLHSRPVGSLSK